MEDQIIENGGSSNSAGRQEYSDRLFYALVASYTDDIRHGLENFMRKNHVGRLDLFKAFLADCGHSIVEAHHLAIIERRRQRKLRTKARNEKIKADRIAAREEYRRKKAEQEKNEGSRSEEVILNELEGYKGNLQSDGHKAGRRTVRRNGVKTCLPSALQT